MPTLRYELNQSISVLLLPAELRLKIWEFVLGCNITVPAAYFVGHRREFPTPSRVRLKAETAENMRFFLSLLRVCRQTYQESRLLAFSCNIWEFWVYGDRYTASIWTPWTKLFLYMNEEQRSAILCVSFKARNGVVRDEPAIAHKKFEELKPLKSVRVVIRETPLHPWDSLAIGSSQKTEVVGL